MEEFAIVEQLTAPDVLLPEQYFGGMVGRTGRLKSPEQRLLWAILEDAINLYLGKFKIGPRLLRERNEAAGWIFDEHHDHPCDFINVCESLGLEPEYIRKGLRGAEADGRSIPMRNRQVIGGTQQRTTPLRVRARA